jgi:UDP:flavonoid glycosyltransferase YjiC (YdhE family)
MDRSDVLVHHGGWGSTIAALATGTPAVVIPLGAWVSIC